MGDTPTRSAGDTHAFDPTARDTLRVLFIGNSYTYVNDLPAVLERLGATDSLASVIETDRVTADGATLQEHWERGEALAAVREGNWDAVVLQERSTVAMRQIDGRPTVSDPASFFEYVRRFDREIRAAGAATALFLTWSRDYAPEQQRPLTEAYMTIGRELGALVVPVGVAWRHALERMPDLRLHMEDHSHPTPAGTYLTAATFYAAFLDRAPAGLSSRASGRSSPLGGGPDDAVDELIDLPPDSVAELRRIAWRTVRDINAESGYLAVAAPTAAPQ